ncbi:MAG: alkaline phosphatase family protein [Bacilli bacterium]|nr:alkaline phosphatase family protein [Bacilli bacterium]
MQTVLPNYQKCITNLSNSILKHFNLETYHNSLPFIDKILDKDYKNVIVVLCDGLGSILLDEILDKYSFLIKNRIKTITSVYPPTTTAATTSILSGLNPNEHGWLGWDLYFKKEDKIITMFLNTLKDTNINAADYNVARVTYPYESITKKIGKFYESYELLSFKNEEYKTLDGLTKKIIELSKTPNKKFIYAYYEEPDSKLHEYGINNEIVKQEFININNYMEYLCNNIEDSVVILTADHGHIDVEYYFLDDYPNIKNMLERTTSLEPRTVSFKVKFEKLEEFKLEFNKYFSNDFILYSQDEIINNKLFGVGRNNMHFEEAIGDFVAVAKNNKAIVYEKTDELLKSHHAGLTEREMLIPIIVKEKPKVKVKGQ